MGCWLLFGWLNRIRTYILYRIVPKRRTTWHLSVNQHVTFSGHRRRSIDARHIRALPGSGGRHEGDRAGRHVWAGTMCVLPSFRSYIHSLVTFHRRRSSGQPATTDPAPNNMSSYWQQPVIIHFVFHHHRHYHRSFNSQLLWCHEFWTIWARPRCFRTVATAVVISSAKTFFHQYSFHDV